MSAAARKLAQQAARAGAAKRAPEAPAPSLRSALVKSSPSSGRSAVQLREQQPPRPPTQQVNWALRKQMARSQPRSRATTGEHPAAKWSPPEVAHQLKVGAAAQSMASSSMPAAAAAAGSGAGGANASFPSAAKMTLVSAATAAACFVVLGPAADGGGDASATATAPVSVPAALRQRQGGELRAALDGLSVPELEEIHNTVRKVPPAHRHGAAHWLAQQHSNNGGGAAQQQG